jgi:hypothetical protein
MKRMSPAANMVTLEDTLCAGRFTGAVFTVVGRVSLGIFGAACHVRFIV